jgi:GAF domain-containing protein
MMATTRPVVTKGADTMNTFGALAQTHWQTQRPAQYALIEDPTAFFTTLGQQISSEIQRRRDEAEQQTGAGRTDSFLANFQGLNISHASIQTEVLTEMVYNQPSE